jgi:uncharacterized protein DUF4440
MRPRLVAAFPLAMVVMFAQNTTHTADRDELQRLETVWNEAHIRGDSATLSRLWADDLEVAVPKMSVMRKGELIKFVDSGRMKFQRYETSDMNFRIYGQSAVVTGRVQRKREINVGASRRCTNEVPMAGESSPSMLPKPRLHKNKTSLATLAQSSKVLSISDRSLKMPFVKSVLEQRPKHGREAPGCSM